MLGLAGAVVTAGLAAAPPASAATTYRVTATIGVGSVPDAVGVDQAAGAAYVANSGSDTVSVISADEGLSLARPADVRVDATGPSGAVVRYALPAVRDDSGDSPVPSVSCVPAPGSMFAIGTTAVTCTAASADDSPPVVRTGFTVTVLGAAAQLAALYRAAQGTGAGTVLADTVAYAQRQLAAGNRVGACVTLQVFIVRVREQTPVWVPAGTAAVLIADAQQIQAVLGCSGLRYPFGP